MDFFLSPAESGQCHEEEAARLLNTDMGDRALSRHCVV